MLTELDVIVFMKMEGELSGVAEAIFGTLETQYELANSDDLGEYCRSFGLGFHAALYPNAGRLLDPEFESYSYALEITSQFSDPELDAVDLEGPLSEYYARQIAFELNVETSTEIFLEGTEESEIFEIQAFRRNPQYRLDQGPTVPKVFVIETRQVERAYEEGEDDLPLSTIAEENGETVDEEGPI